MYLYLCAMQQLISTSGPQKQWYSQMGYLYEPRTLHEMIAFCLAEEFIKS